jgi:hypothetical protein
MHEEVVLFLTKPPVMKNQWGLSSRGMISTADTGDT